MERKEWACIVWWPLSHRITERCSTIRGPTEERHLLSLHRARDALSRDREEGCNRVSTCVFIPSTFIYLFLLLSPLIASPRSSRSYRSCLPTNAPLVSMLRTRARFSDAPVTCSREGRRGRRERMQDSVAACPRDDKSHVRRCTDAYRRNEWHGSHRPAVITGSQRERVRLSTSGGAIFRRDEPRAVRDRREIAPN